MPTYEYACEACEHAFEEYQPITAQPLRKCPSCGANKLKRLIGAGGGLIFKGSGFYLTDYRSDAYKKSAEAEKSSGGAPAPAAGDKPAEKSEKPTESKSPAAGSKDAAAKADLPKPAAKNESKPAPEAKSKKSRR